MLLHIDWLKATAWTYQSAWFVGLILGPFLKVTATAPEHRPKPQKESKGKDRLNQPSIFSKNVSFKECTVVLLFFCFVPALDFYPRW